MIQINVSIYMHTMSVSFKSFLCLLVETNLFRSLS